MTSYEDVYGSLNRHLHTSSSTPVDISSYSVTRNPPFICNDDETLRNNLNRTFRFSDAIFEKHSVSFPHQTITTEQRVSFIRGPNVIRVDYKWSTEYFHFLTEALPNALYAYMRYPSSLVHCGISKFTEPLFRWFGINSQIVDSIPDYANNIYCKYVECGNPSPEKIDLLRKIVTSKLKFERTHGILIRRQTGRRILNEDFVFEYLKGAFPDLTWVIFDSLSVEDTAQLFSKAAVIVGPHGAGLTNMLFSDSGIQIIEFMPLEDPNICYWHLSEMLGNNYAMIPVPVVDHKLNMLLKTAHLESITNYTMWQAHNIGQIKLDQKLGMWIEKYAKDTTFSRYLEIGSWNGRGSTICFAKGFSQRNLGVIEFHSLEINKDRVEESQSFWKTIPHIQIVHGRILPELPDITHVHTDVVKEWQLDDEHHFESAPFVDASDYNAEVVLLDGSEYLTYFEYKLLKDTTKVFLLDDTNVVKCRKIFEELLADPNWKLIDSGNDRNGWAVFQTTQ